MKNVKTPKKPLSIYFISFSETRVRINDFQRFLIYCIYGFGCPLVMIGIAAVMDTVTFVTKKYQPLIGIEKCWIQSGRLAEAIYVHLPISIILVINIVLCSITGFKIFRAQQTTSTVRSKRQNADKERYKNEQSWTLKLFQAFSLQILLVPSTCRSHGRNMDNGITFLGLWYALFLLLYRFSQLPSRIYHFHAFCLETKSEGTNFAKVKFLAWFCWN